MKAAFVLPLILPCVAVAASDPVREAELFHIRELGSASLTWTDRMLHRVEDGGSLAKPDCGVLEKPAIMAVPGGFPLSDPARVLVADGGDHWSMSLTRDSGFAGEGYVLTATGCAFDGG